MVARVSSGRLPRRTSRASRSTRPLWSVSATTRTSRVDRAGGELGVRTAGLGLDVVETGLRLTGDGDAVLARYRVPPPVVERVHGDFDVPRPPGMEAAAVAQEQPHVTRVADRRAARVGAQPEIEPDHGCDSRQNTRRRLGHPPEFEPPDLLARDARAPAHRRLAEPARNPRPPDLLPGKTQVGLHPRVRTSHRTLAHGHR